VPQVRGAAKPFVSKVLPNNGRTALRTRPLETLIIGGWVRGLSDRDIESLNRRGRAGPCVEEHGERDHAAVAGPLPGVSGAQPGRGQAVGAALGRDLSGDSAERAQGRGAGGWGDDEDGRRVLLDVVLGQRDRHDDWLEMGRTLTRRGLRSPMLAVPSLST
jgi:hypothetical protein